MRKFTLSVAVASQILFATLSLVAPTTAPLAQESLAQDSDSDNERVICMTQNALQRFVSAQGYTDLSFQRQRGEYWRVNGVKGGSLYMIVVNTCTQRIVSHSKIGAA